MPVGYLGGVCKNPQIETIIGQKLPTTAFKYRSWWSNDMSQSHVSSWIDAGWRATYVNMSNQTVEFARSRDEDQKHISFYSDIIAELRKQDFPIRDTISPNGARWLYVSTLPLETTDQHAQFRFYFATKDKFRVSLYIDTGIKEQNKAIFDHIYQQRDEIEEEMDNTLSWERMDKKRASRIAIYNEGNINSGEDQLTELVNWAVDSMTSFEKAITTRANKAIIKIMS
jgi:hypothetical protein